MKKIIPMLLATSLILMVISGCVSKKEYEELEQRVSDLEQQVYGNQPDTVNIIESDSLPNNADPTISESSIPVEVNNIWSLDGMSADEIVNLIIEYTTIPEEGTTVEEYVSRFEIEPLYADNATLFMYSNGTVDGTVYASSFVNTVENDIDYNMDGTIHLRGNSSISYISVYISDYETAAAVYSALHAIVMENHEIFEDNSEGNEWYVNTMITTENSTSYQYGTLTMNYREDPSENLAHYLILYRNYN